jgi:hypothetical protein
MPVSKTKARRKTLLKQANVIVFGIGLFLDSLVGIMAYYAATPPFDPVLYGMISAVAKAANLAVHYISKTLKEISGDDTPDPAS